MALFSQVSTYMSFSVTFNTNCVYRSKRYGEHRRVSLQHDILCRVNAPLFQSLFFARLRNRFPPFDVNVASRVKPHAFSVSVFCCAARSIRGYFCLNDAGRLKSYVGSASTTNCFAQTYLDSDDIGKLFLHISSMTLDGYVTQRKDWPNFLPVLGYVYVADLVSTKFGTECTNQKPWLASKAIIPF